MMDEAEKRLRVVLDGILDSTASDAERREFAGLMERHPELADPFIEQLRTHSLLQWQSEEINVLGWSATEAPPIPVGGEGSKAAPPRIRTAWFLAVAVLLAVVASGLFWSGLARQQNPLAVAEIVEENGVVWSEESDARAQGRSINPGRLQIESGALTLRFRSGATVAFRGPATMRIESDMLVRLDRGQATAQVPQWAKGFTIETADVEVIDLGTEFGVIARHDGMTDVVIFEGQVDLKPTGGRRRVQKRLDQGEAVRINSSGAINRIVEVRGDAKGAWSTGNHGGAGGSVFRAIRDNIPPSDGSNYYYYQITPAGLCDDAWAYVDRHPHQWNGLTADGLPEFLWGADYARTFNDYRYIRGFEIVVELAVPADLYVFFDDRVPTPDWLIERFQDTGVDIGLDEGPWEGIPDHVTAVGGGNSIDNVFSVWHRRCERSEMVTLGAVGDSSEARAMYGIAATPLRLDEAAGAFD